MLGIRNARTTSEGRSKQRGKKPKYLYYNMTTDQLGILQNNLHKSKARIHSILNNPNTKQYAILMLQEQYWSTFTKSAPIHHAWTLIEPTVSDTQSQPRSAIYINNNLISPSRITPLSLPFKDVTAAAITIMNEKPMLIINIYNPCDQSIIIELHEYLRRNINRQDYGITVVGGDFNAHHPLWNPRTYTHHDEEADEIVEMMTELELNLMLPAGSITYPHANTTIDLVWGNEEALNQIITCRVAEEQQQGSDHLPIETTLALSIEKPQTMQPFNYTRTDWKELNNKLEQYLPKLPTIKTITYA